MEKIILIDNYDSFTYNLYHQIEKIFDGKIDVYRNDKISLEEVVDYDLIVLSPGPKLPKDAGIMMDVVCHFHRVKPIIGICLGMQAIGEFFGSSLSRMEHPEHGQSKLMYVLEKDVVFQDCPETFYVGRYHSWGIQKKDLSAHLISLSVDDNDWVMALRHKHFKIFGLQYHPESILTEYGDVVMKNILNNCFK